MGLLPRQSSNDADKVFKAEAAGVVDGWLIKTINDDDSGFKTFDAEELLESLKKIFEEDAHVGPEGLATFKITIVFAEPREALYRGQWIRDEIFTSYTDRAWCLSLDGSLYYGQVNSKGQREGEGILY